MPNDLKQFVEQFQVQPIFVIVAICAIYVVLGTAMEELSKPPYMPPMTTANSASTPQTPRGAPSRAAQEERAPGGPRVGSILVITAAATRRRGKRSPIRGNPSTPAPPRFAQDTWRRLWTSLWAQA
jgi:hypothetical protein